MPALPLNVGARLLVALPLAGAFRLHTGGGRRRAAVHCPHLEDMVALGEATVALGAAAAGEGGAVQAALEARRPGTTAGTGEAEGGAGAVGGSCRRADDGGVRIRLPCEE